MAVADPLLFVTEQISDEIDVDWDGLPATGPAREGVVLQLRSLEALSRFHRSLRTQGGEPDPGPVLFRWGPLEALEKLGEGGFAEVFRAWDTSLHRDVALKLRHPGPERSTRPWLDEARRLARVRHPNVVHIYGIDTHDGRPGFWMELIRGETLEAAAARQGVFGAREAAEIGRELCGALAAVHAARLVHGDLKPSNVMREPGERVVLMDFGAGSSLTPGAVSAPVSFATPATAAPEVMLGGEARLVSDIYSMGALLYRLVTGRYPVPGKRITEIRRGHRQETRTPLRDLRPDLPDAFIEAVDHALEPDPDRRTPTADALAAELSRAIGWTPSRSGRDDVASIAVLPLLNLGGDAADDYFADGLAEELLNSLAHVPNLKVIGRTSSFRFRGDEDPARIGRELNVATILTGSVRRSTERVRIRMQLVRASDGVQIWSESHDRKWADLIAIQEDVARAVAGKLEVSLFGTGAPETNPEAYDACLLGNHLIRQGDRESIERGFLHLRKAIGIDPGYALAWARLALAYVRSASFGLARVENPYDEARTAARRSLELDPDLAQGHAVLGLIAMYHDRDWITAGEEIGKARAKAPGDATYVANAGLVALAVGTPEEAMELGRRATELEPLSGRLWINRAQCAFENGLTVEAEMAARRGVELDPTVQTGWTTLARIQVGIGQFDEARASAEREASEPWRLYMLAIVEHAAGRAEASDAALARMIAEYGDDYAFQIAQVFAYREDVNDAFVWLDRAFEQRDAGLVQIRRHPFMASLRSDPRYEAFLERMGVSS